MFLTYAIVFYQFLSLKLFLIVATIPGSSQKVDNGNFRSCPDSPTIKIENKKFCDSKIDCPGGSDEANCTCRQLLSNVNASKICNSVIDCPDRTDETGCGGNKRSSNGPQSLQPIYSYVIGCRVNEISCDMNKKKSACLPLSKRCDGIAQCNDKSDEIGCDLFSKRLNAVYLMMDTFFLL